MAALSAVTGLRSHGAHADVIVHSRPRFFYGVSLPNSKVMQSPQWMPESLASLNPIYPVFFFPYKHTYDEVQFTHRAQKEMNNSN